MASRHSAARPKRGGEIYARTHHNKEEEGSKRVVFDVRDPSKLAPEAREDDDILDSDVIGGKGSTKRGAVNLDGYDSDSDNETFDLQAQNRKRGKVDLVDKLDNYDARKGPEEDEPPSAQSKKVGDDDDEDDDMFAANSDEEDENSTNAKSKGQQRGDIDELDFENKKKQDAQYLDSTEIVGQDHRSKSGGRVHLDNEESSEDEADVELAIQEEGVDEEVGAGGLKKHAPKLEAFNLAEEMEEGQFDASGNYIRRAGDPDAEHDNWLQGMSKKEMKKAAEAHKKREHDARQQRLEADNVLASDLLSELIVRLEKTETPLEALARLGKGQTKPKKVPQWKLKKMNKGAEGMVVDQSAEEASEQARIKESIRAITDAADKLLSRDYEEVYDQEREMLIREYRRETGQDWVERKQPEEADGDGTRDPVPSRQWEFRWIDGRDGEATQGPFDGPTMKAWQDAGYFGEGVEFRPVGESSVWSKQVSFS